VSENEQVMTRNFTLKIRNFIERYKVTILIATSVIFWIAAISYSIFMGSRLPYPDEQWYFNDYAQNLAKLHMFSLDGVIPTAFHPPVYPLFLGLIVSLGLGITTARLMNFLAMYIGMLCLYYLLENWSYKLASLIVVILVMGYLVLFYTAGTLYPQTFATLFFIIAMLFYWKKPFSYGNAILSGFSLGIAILTIPTFLFVPFFFVIFSILFRKDGWAKLGLLLIMVFLVISTWSVRNYQVFNRFELISSNFGTNFLIGNNPATSPNNGPAAISGVTQTIEKADQLGLDEFQRNKFYTKQALEFIQNDPVHYLTLYLLKVANYFNFHNQLLTASESSLAKDLVMLLTFGSFLPLAILRIVLFRKYPFSQLEGFLILLYICSAFVSAIVFTRIRYRLPFDYLLITFVAIFLEKLLLGNPNTNQFIETVE
jgi:4-amino-4-deoxy-L-arabinose transferase-like glycosyltransferase